ncbi:ATP-binding protein [Pleomorphovibrio marinus]|uniref:ATP-binding protein n=1 Tax=Pleomorphovibrio marinus TaxID=2164132 RepID=UPI000E0CA26F|nr:ATP-binding protein [Pleomorphovibrio marinus]
MRHELNLSCEKSRLADLRLFLSKVLEPVGISEIAKNQIILAVEEVCANLIIHSHECNPKDCIHLKVMVHEQKIIFEIADSGLAFNLLEYQSPALSEVVRKKKKGGLGILLVRKIMDKIEFENREDKNICRLVKRLNSK